MRSGIVNSERCHCAQELKKCYLSVDTVPNALQSKLERYHIYFKENIGECLVGHRREADESQPRTLILDERLVMRYLAAQTEETPRP